MTNTGVAETLNRALANLSPKLTTNSGKLFLRSIALELEQEPIMSEQAWSASALQIISRTISDTHAIGNWLDDFTAICEFVKSAPMTIVNELDQCNRRAADEFIPVEKKWREKMLRFAKKNGIMVTFQRAL